MRVLLAICLFAACGDNRKLPEAPADASIDAALDASCFEHPDPNSNEQIINACTTAQKIYKDSHPPLLNPDGTLPPLPQ